MSNVHVGLVGSGDGGSPYFRGLVKLATFGGVSMMTELIKWAALARRLYRGSRGGSHESFGSAWASLASSSSWVIKGTCGRGGWAVCAPSEGNGVPCCAPSEVRSGSAGWAPSEDAC